MRKKNKKILFFDLKGLAVVQGFFYTEYTICVTHYKKDLFKILKILKRNSANQTKKKKGKLFMKKELKQQMPQIRAHIPNELVKALKIYAAENETTVQAILEEYVKKLLNDKTGGNNK
jgi:hypothetical protein